MTILNLNTEPEISFSEDNFGISSIDPEKSSLLNIDNVKSSSISTGKINRTHSRDDNEKSKDFVERPKEGFTNASNSYTSSVSGKKSHLSGSIHQQQNVGAREKEAVAFEKVNKDNKERRRSTEGMSNKPLVERRPSEIVRLLENKVCEGSLMHHDIGSKSWTKIYVILTKSCIYFYQFKREYEISRMGYKTGKSKVTIGEMLRDPVPILKSNLYLCHLPNHFLGRRYTFKISSTSFSIFLSTCLSKKPNRDFSDVTFSNAVEITLLKRWSKAIQSVGAKVHLAMFPKGLYPQPIEDDLYSCINCGCNVHRYRRHLVEEKDEIKQKQKQNIIRDFEVRKGRAQQQTEDEKNDEYCIDIDDDQRGNKEDQSIIDEGFFDENDREKKNRNTQEKKVKSSMVDQMKNDFFEENLIAFYPKPTSQELVSEIPCAFLKTSYLQCERCQILSESLKLKRINMTYRRYNLMLNEAKVRNDTNYLEEEPINETINKKWNYSTYKKDSALKTYFDDEDINTKEWPLELPPAIPISEADFTHGRKQENGHLLLRRGNPPEIPIDEYKVKGLFAPPRIAGKGKRKIFG